MSAPYTVDPGQDGQDIMLKDENGLVVATLMHSYHEEGEAQVMATAHELAIGAAAKAFLEDLLLEPGRHALPDEMIERAQHLLLAARGQA